MKKQFRIKKNEEFSRILSLKRVKSSRLFVIYHAPKREENARVGISVSKKLGDAVTRNKVKRQLRMMCLSVIDFEKDPMDLVIIVRKPFLEGSFQDNKNDLEKLIKKNIIKQYE